jgi:hypothetical protein
MKKVRVHRRELREPGEAVVPLAHLDGRELGEALQEVVVAVGVIVAPA